MDPQESQSASIVQKSKEPAKPRRSLAREKSKRPQLSCNACRSRKVKCDRIQPCTACSLHQVARECVYELSESERHPILQAEALREKDKEIARLRLEIAAMGEISSRTNSSGSPNEPRRRRKGVPGEKNLGGSGSLDQDSTCSDEASGSSVHGGAMPVSGVIGNVCLLDAEVPSSLTVHKLSRLRIQSVDSTFPDSSLCGPEVNFFSSEAPHPFGRFWEANEGPHVLAASLPAANEILACYQFFRSRSQGCSLPIVAAEFSQLDLDQVISNVERYIEHREDTLAFLFAILAQGVQHGLYDRCRGTWISGTMDDSLKKGDIYVASALQALRLASFTSRPTLLAIQTLIIIGSYFADAGRCSDSWSIFYITTQISRILQLHLDPSRLNMKQNSLESNLRRALWWWILQADQQYSMTLNRPLAISNISDCMIPDASRFPPYTQKVIDHYFRFTVLAREALSDGNSTDSKANHCTEGIISMLKAVPIEIRFHSGWLDKEITTPPWPMDLQIASLHQQIHNCIIFLHRRKEDGAVTQTAGLSIPQAEILAAKPVTQPHPRILESCREVLKVLEYFSNRQNRGWINWSICQQAYNAAVILGTSMSTLGDLDDKRLLNKTRDGFAEIHRLGIHRLAGVAAETLGKFLEVDPSQSMSLVPRTPSNNSVLDYNSRQLPPLKAGLNSPLPNSASPQIKGGRRRGRDQRAKDENSPSNKRTRWSESAASVKTSKTDSPKPQKRQSLSLSKGGLVNAGSILENSRGTKNAKPAACKASGYTATSVGDKTGQTNASSPSTNSFHFSQMPNLGQRQQISTSMPATDACALSQFLLDRQNSFAPAEEIQALLPLASPTSQSFPSNFASHPPSLSGHSYPSSIYTNSVPSSLHTPLASHPVSPLLGHGNLNMLVDQASYCASQSITQPQTPSLQFDAAVNNEEPEYVIGNSSTMEQQEDVRWLWSNSASW